SDSLSHQSTHPTWSDSTWTGSVITSNLPTGGGLGGSAAADSAPRAVSSHPASTTAQAARKPANPRQVPEFGQSRDVRNHLLWPHLCPESDNGMRSLPDPRHGRLESVEATICGT